MNPIRFRPGADLDATRSERQQRARTSPYDFVLHAHAARILLQRRKTPFHFPDGKPVIRARQSKDPNPIMIKAKDNIAASR